MKLSFGGETRRPAAGFTLLEVIVSAGISVVLVYAIYRSVAMHHLQIQSGREIAEGAQLARGLLQQIQADLRATFVHYRAAGAAGATPAGAAGGAAAGAAGQTPAGNNTTTSSTTATLKDEYDVPAGGVLGFSNSITAVVRVAPDRDIERSGSLLAGTSAMSDLRIVRYHLIEEGGQDGTNQSGLVRDLLYRIPDPERNSDPLESARIDLLASEVKSLTILYYDGIEWTTTWESDVTKAPKAIDVTLGIKNSNQSASSTGDETQTYYRILVALDDSN